jgi:hypothetical protein
MAHHAIIPSGARAEGAGSEGPPSDGGSERLADARTISGNTAAFAGVESQRDRGARRWGVIRAVLAVAGGNSAAMILGSVGGILAARFIVPETAGHYRAYTIPLLFLAFLHLGTFEGISRQVPLHLGQQRKDLAEAAAASAAAWNLLLSGVVSCAFVGLAAFSGVRGDTLGALGWGTQAAIAWWIFYGGYLAATYRTLDQFAGLARIQALQATMSFLLVFTLPVLGFLGLCARAAIPSTAGTWLLHRVRPLAVKPSGARQPLLNLIRVGLPFCFWGSLYTSLWAAVENTLFFTLAGARGLGLFTVAIVLREGICILPQAVHQVLTPRIVEAYGTKGRLGIAAASAYKLVVPLTVAMTVLVLFVSQALDALVPVLIPEYVDGLALMKVSLWLGVVQASGLPLNALLASGRGWTYGRPILVGLVTFPIAAYLLTPHIGGLLAVAVGSLVGRIARTGAGYWELRAFTQRESGASP